MKETLGRKRRIKLEDLPKIEVVQSSHHYTCTGATYRGTWLYGMRHGEGTMNWNDGASYSGIW